MLSYLCEVPIPIFVIYELLARIHQLEPALGTYVSHTMNTSGAVIVTTQRKVRIRSAILNRQFRNPVLVLETDLLLIIKKGS